MDRETMKYIEDGKLILNNEGLDFKEALLALEDFEEEETAKCVWCGDDFPVDELHREKDMGYLCDHCKRGLESRGEELEFEDEFDESLKESDEETDYMTKGDREFFVKMDTQLKELIISLKKDNPEQYKEMAMKWNKDNPNNQLPLDDILKESNERDVKILGGMFEFVEGRHLPISSRIGKLLTIDEINKTLSSEHFSSKMYGEPGYDKCYVDIIVEVDGKKYKFHGLRFDLGGSSNDVVINQEDLDYVIDLYKNASEEDLGNPIE